MSYSKNVEPCVAALDSDISNWDKETDVAIVGLAVQVGAQLSQLLTTRQK